MISKKAIDHDRLFKELLETFFVEFISLFFPDDFINRFFRDLFTINQEWRRNSGDGVAQATRRGGEKNESEKSGRRSSLHNY